MYQKCRIITFDFPPNLPKNLPTIFFMEHLLQGLYCVDALAVDHMIRVCQFQARREPKRGPGKHSREGDLNIFTGPL